jgi:hypothetical protein
MNNFNLCQAFLGLEKYALPGTRRVFLFRFRRQYDNESITIPSPGSTDGREPKRINFHENKKKN